MIKLPLNSLTERIVSQQLSCPENFMMKTFKWYGPYYFGVDIPKMHVYISETVADRNYYIIKMAVKNSQHLLFWSSSKQA